MLALRCPACSRPLEHAHHRRLHVCVPCQKRWVPSGGERETLRSLPTTVVRPVLPVPAPESVVLVPVWSLQRGEAAPGAGTSPLYVPAVGWSRMALLLAFAERMSRDALAWEREEDAPPRPLLPGDVRVEEAFELAEIVALALDPRQGLDAEGELAFGGAQLLDWPCVRRSSQLVELVGGRAVSDRLVDGLVADSPSEGASLPLSDGDPGSDVS